MYSGAYHRIGENVGMDGKRNHHNHRVIFQSGGVSAIVQFSEIQEIG